MNRQKTHPSSEPGIERRREMNEALIVSSVHQHELIEQAHKAEALLRASEERARAILEAAPVALFVCDDKAVIQQYNRRASELWGRSPICGVDRYCGSVNMWLPDGALLPREQSPIVEVLRSGTPALNVEYSMEQLDGSRLPVLANFSPLKNEQGEITGAIASFIDLSDRKAVENELRQSEARFRLMAETMPQKIFTADPKGDITYFNPQWIEFTGSSFDQMKGWGWTQFVHPDDVDESIRAWRHSIDTGEPFLFEHRLRQADGQYCWHISRAVPLRNGEGQILMWVGSNTDVDDARKADEAMRARLEGEVNLRTAELLAINEQLQGFTYSVAHDLRQQIRGINSNASMLMLDSATLDPESRQTLKRLIDSSKRLANLADDLLAYARVGRQELDKQPFDFTALCEEVGAFLIDRGTCRKGTKLKIARGLVAQGDVMLMRIVVENLLDNACKYSAEKENPVIEVGREGGALFVRDNGIGFDMRFQHKLFQPFERLHADSAYAGTGIGLANVKRIVEKHGGKVWAEGKPGEGATFYFSLG